MHSCKDKTIHIEMLAWLRHGLVQENTAMANNLPTDKKIQIIANLAEGSSIRAIERITGVHRDTVIQ